jgi:hypothetical protein
MQAKETLKEMEQGAFELEDGDAVDKKLPRATDLRFWNPEAAALWSVILTPMFVGILHFLNDRQLGVTTMRRWAVISLLADSAVTLTLVWLLRTHWNVWTPFLIGGMLSWYTIASFFLVAQGQSKYLVSEFGSKYPRKGLMQAVLVGLALMMLAGIIGRLLQDQS